MFSSEAQNRTWVNVIQEAGVQLTLLETAKIVSGDLTELFGPLALQTARWVLVFCHVKQRCRFG